MGYRKDIKNARRDIAALLEQIEDGERMGNWEQVKHLADTLYSRAWELTNAADNKSDTDY